MSQIQPFQKHWLQLTSIVVCRLKLIQFRIWVDFLIGQFILEATISIRLGLFWLVGLGIEVEHLYSALKQGINAVPVRALSRTNHINAAHLSNSSSWTKDELLKWAAFMWFVRDSALTGTGTFVVSTDSPLRR